MNPDDLDTHPTIAMKEVMGTESGLSTKSTSNTNNNPPNKPSTTSTTSSTPSSTSSNPNLSTYLPNHHHHHHNNNNNNMKWLDCEIMQIVAESEFGMLPQQQQ